MRTFGFLTQFMAHPIRTGAIMPSSNKLANIITDSASLGDASVIIEWGAGTGVFTEKILQKKRSDALFFAMEMNETFAAETQARCPEAKIYHDSAINTPAYLKQHGHSHCDIVLCGLPWASFNESLQDDLLNTLSTILRPGGRFLTFAYLQGLLLPAGLRFRRRLLSRFKQVTTTPTVWRNLPPAFVYVCER